MKTEASKRGSCPQRTNCRASSVCPLPATPRWLVPPFLAFLLLAGVTFVGAQSYSIDWCSMDSGGTSTGGVYLVSGSIGQLDAEMMTGGSFTLEGGFEGIIVQLPGPPYIVINLSATNSVSFSWLAGSTTWQLQENTNLNTTNWVNVGTPPQQVGGVMQVIVSPPPGTHFYRLLSP